MSLKDLKENRAVAGQLAALLRSGRAVHAFLFVGPSDESSALGKAFAKALLCPQKTDDSCDSCAVCRRFDHGNCEDLLTVECTENRQSIVVSQIEVLQENLKYKASGNARVVLIKEAQLMNPAAQNKLLKTLEEPFPGTYLILLASSRETLLPTILSRCSIYTLQETTASVSGEIRDAAEQFVYFALRGAAYYEKKNCIRYILDAKDESRAKGLELLQALEEVLHEKALGCAADPAGSREVLDRISNAMHLCEESAGSLRASYNTAYVLKTLCLKI